MKMNLLSIEETKELIRNMKNIFVDENDNKEEFEKSLESIFWKNENYNNENYWLRGIIKNEKDWIVVSTSHGMDFVWITDDLSDDLQGSSEEIYGGDLSEYDVPYAIEKRIFTK